MCVALLCSPALCFAGSVQPADKKKNWSSFLDDDNGKAAQTTSSQSQRVSSASLEGLTQSQAGDVMTQDHIQDQLKGSGSLRDSSESDSSEPDATELSLRQRASGYAEPKTKAAQTGTTTQQSLTEQRSQQTRSLSSTAALPHPADMPYSASSLSNSAMGVSSVGVSEANFPSTNAGVTGLSQTGLSQSQRAVTQPQGESLSQLPESASRSVAEGLPADWDWEGYLRLNPDVATAVGTDAASAKLHWLTWGQAEKRPYKVSAQPFRPSLN